MISAATPPTVSIASVLTIGELVALVTIIITIISVVGGAVWFLATLIAAVRRDISSIHMRMEAIERDNYTKPEAEAHALRLAINNPHLRVPDPRNLKDLINTGSLPSEHWEPRS